MRQLAAIAVFAVVAAACSTGAGQSDSGTPTDANDPAATTTTPETTPDAPPCTPTRELPGGDVETAPAGDRLLAIDTPGARVRDGFDPNRIVDVLPPDAIRPIDEPCFDAVETAGRWLQPVSPVLQVEVNGDQRAYPLGIMTQHEIVNDVIGGVPVTVTYCPLCNSGLAFERELDGVVHSFGTSGSLFQSNLVMWDRQTSTVWSQSTGEALVGDLVPVTLERITTSLLAFDEFAELAPDGLVLSPQVDDSRDYTRNPYPGYDDRTIDFGLFEGDTDDRLDPSTRVVGVGAEDGAPVAVTLAALREARTVAVEVAEQPVVVFWAPGAASALDTGRIDDGRDVGQSAAFVVGPEDGDPGGFRAADDDPTTFVGSDGTRWNLLGEAVGGPREGARLAPAHHDDTFWFVWFAFQPTTTVVDGT